MSGQGRRVSWWAWPLLPALLAVALVAALLWLLLACGLLVLVWTTWLPRGRSALVVYSNSPIWRDYFERHVLPAVAGRAVVLNWSERSHWKPSLAVSLFRTFGGTREFNPIAFAFPLWARPRTFRFYRAFQAFKHGSDQVDQLRRDFLRTLDGLSARPPDLS